ncbi:peroxiredoxin HYR1 [Hyaloraphidium curvatum]|nr:peroxiredoxin HYR1 [Hyaloraphidium curvatum]
MAAAAPFYAFKPKDHKGKEFDFAQLKGKVVLVVNVASKCGFTPQYKGLEDLYEKYHDKGLEIIGFPCNQFGGQEPGSEEEIVEFCSNTWNVKFPIMKKVEVNGDNVEPVYQYLKSQKSWLGLSRVKWNFEKFLVDKNGKVVERYSSTSTPESIVPKIEALLK